LAVLGLARLPAALRPRKRRGVLDATALGRGVSQLALSRAIIQALGTQHDATFLRQLLLSGCVAPAVVAVSLGVVGPLRARRLRRLCSSLLGLHRLHGRGALAAG